MSQYLLDTHAFIWWLADDKALPERATRIIQAGDNEIIVSLVTAWEIAIRA